jgi:hypothetical protein
LSPLALFIASQLRLANDYARDSAVLADLGSRNAATLLFQAVEAALLAVLTSEGLDRSHRSTQHQLGVMTDMLPDENPLKASFGAVALLTGYATSYRYASASGRVRPGPSADQLSQWMTAATTLIAACAAGFQVDLANPGSGAASTLPLRGLAR